jgi:FkbM family methyltransferase
MSFGRAIAGARWRWSQWQDRHGFIARGHRFGDALASDLRTLLPPHATVLDVGANTGQSIESFLRAQPTIEVHAFEPAVEATEVLRRKFALDERVHVHAKAISTEPGDVTLHVTRNSVGSSLLRPSTFEGVDWLDEVGSYSVPAIRLDTFLEERLHARQIDLLKVDAQGVDLDVLRSMGAALHPTNVAAVLVETAFEPFYEGQRSPVEILAHMESCGYRPAAFYEIHRRTDNVITWCDVLYLGS